MTPTKRLYQKSHSPYDTWESCQVPEKRSSVCFNCGWLKRHHLTTKLLKKIKKAVRKATKGFVFDGPKTQIITLTLRRK
jgi:hypothetical protein